MAPSTLNTADREQVKRVVPSASNKVVAEAVARLYVNYPDPNKWNYTGISGALVLANDLVGKTYFFKIVDVSVRILSYKFVCKFELIDFRRLYRQRTVAYYGIKNFTKEYNTIRIEHSSIHSK